jgi:hypothetical protein
MTLLSVKQVSEILQKSEYSVRYRILGYELPYVSVLGSKMVEQEDLENYIKRNKTMNVR